MNEKQGRERNSDKDATKLYLKEVSRNALLNHAQEIELSQQIETARHQIVLHLFEIPLCVDNFRRNVENILEGRADIKEAFDLEDAPNEDLQGKLAALLLLISQLNLNDERAEQIRLEVAQQISQLPFRSAFYDSLIQAVTSIVKETTRVSGEFMRFAHGAGVTREQFLANYQNPTPNDAWQLFASSHHAQVAAYQQQLADLSASAGMSASSLQAKITEIRAVQKQKDTAVETMLKSNLRLVVSVAKKYINVSPTPLLDLVQEGNIGLLKAIEKYDWRLGFRFSTYATWWIKQCVLKALNEQHRTIKVPSHMTDLVKRVARARDDYSGLYGFEPSPVEIAKILGVEPHVVARVWTVAQGTISLETPIGSDEEQSLGAVIEDKDSLNAFDQISAVDTVNAVADVLRQLSPKEERVIRMRFGIGVDNESTLEDIGLKFGVTRERIRQIEFKALDKLKQPDLAQKIQEAFE